MKIRREIEVKHCCRNCAFGNRNLKEGDICKKSKYKIFSMYITTDCNYFKEKSWASPNSSKYHEKDKEG